MFQFLEFSRYSWDWAPGMFSELRMRNRDVAVKWQQYREYECGVACRIVRTVYGQ